MSESPSLRGCLLVVILVTLALAGLFADQPAGQSRSSGTLRLLTHNLHAEETELDPMVAVLRAADADIVTLQEVSQAAVDRFTAEFGDRYPYTALNLEHGRYNGLAILSRYPVVDQAFQPFPRRLLRARLDVNGTAITVFNVHPASPGNTNFDIAPRSADIAFALEQASVETNPVLLMGDFNMEEWSDDYDAVTALYGDAFAAVGEGDGLTYPDYSYPQAQVNARLPVGVKILIRLDYIFYSAHFRPLVARVWPDSGGSDHRPVYAELSLNSD